MSQQLLQVNLPSELYDKLLHEAEESQRQPEDVLVERLERSYEPEPDSDDLGVLDNLSDQQIWAVVHQRLAPYQETRMKELIQQSKESALSEHDENELAALLDEVDRQMLFRSKALLLLKQRGYDVNRYFNLS
jgi:hypothetical protein